MTATPSRLPTQKNVAAVVLRWGPRGAASTLEKLRRAPSLRGVPVIVEGALGVKPAGADALATTLDELEKVLAASVKARRLVERDDFSRLKLELLLELHQLSGRSEAQALAVLAAQRLESALRAEHAEVMLLEPGETLSAFLIDKRGLTPVDLAASPLLRRVLEVQQPVASGSSIAIPIAHDGMGPVAIILRRTVPLELDERDFVVALGATLASAFSQQRAQRDVAKTREALQAAYVERYRELLDMNRRLKVLDRKKDELMAVLSHDLRAPLNVLLGHSHLLLTDGTLPAPLQPSVEAVQRTSQRLLALVESLLEQSREDEASRIVLFSKTMDVAETCQEAVGDLQVLAPKRGLTLRAEAPMSLMVQGDELKLRQVLQNLITNAIDHANGATQVVVRAKLRTRPDGDVALVEVRDNGHVDDPDSLLLAFERSKGLGLAICRDFVERHGGEIWAEAPRDGGALFAFTLPLSAGTRTPAPRPDVPLVLIADADPVFVRSCTLAFSGHYRVEVARDGDDVVEKTKRLNPDVLVLDAFMPRRDGLDALRELREYPATSRIPVLLVSGNAELTHKLSSHELGANGVLTKPFAMTVLLSLVQEVLQRTARGRPGTGPGIDQLTGLFDHVGIVNRLEQELDRSVRYGRPLMLSALVPRSVPPADELVRVAAALRAELRAPDLIGHVGHGTFVVVSPETSAEAGRLLIDRLMATLEGLGLKYLSRVTDVRDSQASAERLIEQLLGEVRRV